MTSPESLQMDMFSGQLVDNRTRQQRSQDREREQPQPQLMFSQRDIAQFGVHAHPLIPLSPHTKLVLICEDPRTDEERERDIQREAERLTQPLFTLEAAEVVIYDASSKPRVRPSSHTGYRLQSRRLH